MSGNDCSEPFNRADPSGTAVPGRPPDCNSTGSGGPRWGGSAWPTGLLVLPLAALGGLAFAGQGCSSPPRCRTSRPSTCRPFSSSPRCSSSPDLLPGRKPAPPRGADPAATFGYFTSSLLISGAFLLVFATLGTPLTVRLMRRRLIKVRDPPFPLAAQCLLLIHDPVRPLPGNGWRWYASHQMLVLSLGCLGVNLVCSGRLVRAPACK